MSDTSSSLSLRSPLRTASAVFALVVLGSIGQMGCNRSDQSPSVSDSPTGDVVGQRIEFKAGVNSERYRVSGWSASEPNFTWSEGTSAKLALPISAADGGLTVKVTMASLNHLPQLPFQPVELYANGQKVAEWQVGDMAEFVATIPGEITKAGGTLTLEFRTPKATSPKTLGVNADPRVLGVCVSSLELARTT
ncbi:MAG: hypothetical protein QOD99_3108 [Chthoniobacter sp.]|nr:hypothetical protein [Chthoniobacter sp.]